MKRFSNGFMRMVLGSVCAVSLLYANVSVGAGVQTQSPNSWPVDLAIQVQRVSGNVEKVSTGVQKEIEAQAQGFNTMVSEAGSAVVSTVTDSYKAATEYVDGQIQKVGDYAMEQASAAGETISGWFSSSDSSDTPGDGFSFSETMSGIKEATSKYGKYLSPALKLAQGDFFGAASSIRDTLYTGAIDKDELSTYDVTKVLGNLKKFVQEATRTAIADATQVMNGTVQYDKIQKSSSKEKPATVREDIKASNDTGLSMNVMTNVLLSMDNTELSIQSAMIYNNINSISGGSFLFGN